MRASAVSALLASAAAAAAAVVPSLWDGQCFYPVVDPAVFALDEYLGKWYQVAGTRTEFFTEDCACVTAEYERVAYATVSSNNTCVKPEGQPSVRQNGVGTPAAAAYGHAHTFKIHYEGEPDEHPCPGGNYAVQEYLGDFSIVQTWNFTTLRILSRSPNPDSATVDALIAKAGELGSNVDDVVKVTGC